MLSKIFFTILKIHVAGIAAVCSVSAATYECGPAAALSPATTPVHTTRRLPAQPGLFFMGDIFRVIGTLWYLGAVRLAYRYRYLSFLPTGKWGAIFSACVANTYGSRFLQGKIKSEIFTVNLIKLIVQNLSHI